jgi:hypothetical protein
VPSDTLRTQIYDKFLTVGLLKELGVLGAEAQFPVACKLKHTPKSPEDVDRIFQSCNVVVATMDVMSPASETVLKRIAEQVTHLFIDEAHHLGARTWSFVKGYSLGKPVLQFTATPFRRDGKRIQGKYLYSYPLRKAQEDGYFKKIRYRPVYAFSRAAADRDIARAAVAQLKEDLKEFDHLVMARTDSIERAGEVLRIYQAEAPEYQPVMVHSGPGGNRESALAAIVGRQSRIVVCVDMLGEGFDLPELKIAALHDVHKSLAITLQFTGRFTRSKKDLGDATMIARADAAVDEALRVLYSEDPDWNHIIQKLSEEAIEQEVAKSEFEKSFAGLPDEVAIQSILPKMSTVVYETTCTDWKPTGILEAVKKEILFTAPSVSNEHRVAWFVTKETEPVPWGMVRELENTEWHLYLLHWDAEKGLLYVNSSNNSVYHEKLAKKVCGDDVNLIKGEDVFRSLHGIARLSFITVGLLQALGRSIRHMMLNGSAVEEGLTPAEKGTKSKTNVFGRGYEDGSRTTIGCSKRGRIWSMKAAEDIAEWVHWCHHIGKKLIDKSIDVEELMRGVIIPQFVTERPKDLVPLAIDWPEELYARNEELITLQIGDTSAGLFEVSLELTDHTKNGDISFELDAGGRKAKYKTIFGDQGVSFKCVSGKEAVIAFGKKRMELSDFFRTYSPLLIFEGDMFIENSHAFQVKRNLIFDVGTIEAWDWNGVDIAKESQGVDKKPGTVQYKAIQEVLADPTWDIVFDDDEKREAADVVAIKQSNDRLVVHFYHCKFSLEAPGARVDDLYTVCGQAQKSIRWREHLDGLFEHLQHRQQQRLDQGLASRFERGDPVKLQELRSRARLLLPEMAIYIIQPGLSKAKVGREASQSLLELLACTQLYLSDFQIRFGVVSSA